MLKHLLVILFFAFNAHADPGGWVFLYEESGFKTYEHKGPPVAYKAEGSVDIPLAELAAVLVDVPRQKEWVSHMVESRLIEGDIITRSVVYSRYDLPWPAKDRDAVIESVVEEDVEQAEVRVRFRNTTCPAAPPRSDSIRVPKSEGEFTLKDTGNGSVIVSYTIHLDPGGWLPGWIVRLFVQDAPVITLRAFKAQVLKTRGQYSDFITQQKARWAGGSQTVE